jgi:hypothetical protein
MLHFGKDVGDCVQHFLGVEVDAGGGFHLSSRLLLIRGDCLHHLLEIEVILMPRASFFSHGGNKLVI